MGCRPVCLLEGRREFSVGRSADAGVWGGGGPERVALSNDGLVLASGTRDGVAGLMRFTPVLTEPELQIEVEPGVVLEPGEEFAATLVINH